MEVSKCNKFAYGSFWIKIDNTVSVAEMMDRIFKKSYEEYYFIRNTKPSTVGD